MKTTNIIAEFYNHEEALKFLATYNLCRKDEKLQLQTPSYKITTERHQAKGDNFKTATITITKNRTGESATKKYNFNPEDKLLELEDEMAELVERAFHAVNS